MRDPVDDVLGFVITMAALLLFLFFLGSAPSCSRMPRPICGYGNGWYSAPDGGVVCSPVTP